MLPSGYVLYKYKQLDSTSAEALRLLQKNKIQNNTIIIADLQTAGKGRNEKKWISISGNLHMTIVIKRSVDIHTASQLSFVTAIAVGQALNSNILYKWPNDILLEKKKVCGILLESHSREFVIVGIGINISHAPDYATYLNRYDDIDINQLICNIINNFDHQHKQWCNHGFASTRQEWLSKAWSLNQAISVNLQNKIIKGIFQGIDAEGRLILKTANDVFCINSGELYNSGR